MRRWFPRVLLAISLASGAGTIFFWARGTDWIRRSAVLSRPTGYDGTDVGIWSIGFYSSAGRIGFLYLESGVTGLEPDEMPGNGPDPQDIGWLWTRDGVVHDYMGGIPDEIYPEWMVWGSPRFICIWAGKEAGMRHFLGTNAIFAADWLVISISALPWVIYLSARTRQHRRNRKGLCARCGYDLRGTPNRCPECGEIYLLAETSRGIAPTSTDESIGVN